MAVLAGALLYGYGNPGLFAWDVAFARRQAEQGLPVHKAHKKIPALGPDGDSAHGDVETPAGQVSGEFRPAEPHPLELDAEFRCICPRGHRLESVEFRRTASHGERRVVAAGPYTERRGSDRWRHAARAKGSDGDLCPKGKNEIP